MLLPNKIYDFLKWIVILFIPALAMFYSSLANIWGWGYVDEVPKTLYAVETFFGAILGISTMSYENKKKEELAQAKEINKQEG